MRCDCPMHTVTLTLPDGRLIPARITGLELTVSAGHWQDVQPRTELVVQRDGAELFQAQIDEAEQDDAPHGLVKVRASRKRRDDDPGVSAPCPGEVVG